jgi:hypothetical protein
VDAPGQHFAFSQRPNPRNEMNEGTGKSRRVRV